MRKRVGIPALAGLVATAALACGGVATAPPSPVNNLVLVNASENMCLANATCPQDPAPPGPDLGDQASAERHIIDGYLMKQRDCTPDLAPNPQGVTWDSPGFTPNVGGMGTVRDADPGLGGQFRADWVDGRWHIEYPYC
jgi:hypothetical protein